MKNKKIKLLSGFEVEFNLPEGWRVPNDKEWTKRY